MKSRDIDENRPVHNCEISVLICVKSKHGCSSGMMSWIAYLHLTSTPSIYKKVQLRQWVLLNNQIDMRWYSQHLKISQHNSQGFPAEFILATHFHATFSFTFLRVINLVDILHSFHTFLQQKNCSQISCLFTFPASHFHTFRAELFTRFTHFLVSHISNFNFSAYISHFSELFSRF